MKPFYQQYWVTSLLMALCIAIFVVQVISGVSASSPATQDLYAWGANWFFNSFTDEPWRMLTSVFLHVGFIHIAFNMFALSFFGKYSEVLFGKWFYVAIFILSGIGGNMLNNGLTLYSSLNSVLTESPVVSAGASGGILGLNAALLVCSLFKSSINGVTLHKMGLIQMMVINLSIGFIIPNIDNAAHIGGAVTGASMALLFAFFYKNKVALVGKLVASIGVLVLLAGVFWYVSANYYEHIMQSFQQLIININQANG